MSKKIVWKNPNKMIFESGYLSYDNYVDIISSGNCIARGWVSMCVRSHNTIECGYNNIRDPGYFTKWDLDNGSLPGNIYRFAMEYAKNNPDKSFCWSRMSTGRGREWYMLYNNKGIIKTWCKTEKQYAVCKEAEKYLID